MKTIPEMNDAGERVLILAPVGRDASTSADLLAKAGLVPHVCATYSDLMATLPDGAIAILVAEEALFGRDLTALESWVAEQPAWSDLPFVVLTSRRQDPRVDAWRHGLLGSLRNVSLLERPIHSMTLWSTVQAAVRARRRQYEVRALLEVRQRAAEELQRKIEDATAVLRREMAERARMEEALRQSQKMEAVGQLTGGVAHDFNNLLMVIIAGLEMIQRHRHSDRFDGFVESMRNSALRGASLTRQLLAFARRQPLKPEPVDLAAHVGQMGDLLDRSLGANVRLQTYFSPGLWRVQADPGELELVLLNLAFNARDAMPGGGVITVTGENVQAGTADGGDGDCVRLTVEDTGTGMPPDVAARAFEPFFTTKEVGKGSGLGLAQTYGFARQSGGSARIESEIGRGTRIVLLLPRSHDQASVSYLQPELPRAVESGNGRILVVEDDEAVAGMVAGMLSQLGYDVLRASDAAGALRAVDDGEAINLVFSDIVMPGGMDGLGLARELRSRCPELPVVLTSGHPGTASSELEGSGLRVLAKPYSLDELRAVLQQTVQLVGR